MTKTPPSSKTRTKKSDIKTNPSVDAAQANTGNLAKQPLYRLRSLMPALLIIGGIVAIAAITQNSRGLDTYPIPKSVSSPTVRAESVLASTTTPQNQPESSSDAPSTPISDHVSVTPIKQAASASTPAAIQPPSPAPTVQPQPSQPTSGPVATDPPEAPLPPVETPHPKPRPHHDKGLFEVVDDLLSTLL